MVRIEIIKAILSKEKRSIERFNYLTSLTDKEIEREYLKTLNQ